MIAFLVSLGFTQKNAEKIAENTPDTGADMDQKDLDALVSSYKKSQRDIFENDADFIGKIQTAEKAKQLDIITREIKKNFDLTPDEIKDKSIKEVIEIAKTKIGSSADKDVKTLQDELTKASARVKELEETEIPKIKGEVDGHKKTINVENALVKYLGSKKLRVELDAAYPGLKAYLEENYDIDLDEKDKKKLVLFQKGTKLSPLSADKSKTLTVDEITDGKLKEWKFLEESKADKPGKDKNIDIDDDDDKGTKTSKVYSPHADAAAAHLQAIKDAKK